MKCLGITAEYNPFHNGHVYNIEKAKRLCGADTTIIAMSGNFTQRGELAVLDKWQRSMIAAKSGADLVVEIPFVFACNRAEHYARGAVDTLVALGADFIAFGCEAENPWELLGLAKALRANEKKISSLMKNHMDNGLSAAKAREMAVRVFLGEDASGLMLSPNNILAIEYIKRIDELNENGANIEAMPVLRKGSGYFGENPEEGFAGATNIRKMLAGCRAPEDLDQVKKYVPESTYDVLREENAKECFADREQRTSEKLFEMLSYEITRSTADELAEIYGIGEGIQNRMKKVITEVHNLDEFRKEMVSKRYTAATINRMAMYILTGLKKGTGPEDRDIEYIRILAANERGRKFLKEGKKAEAFKVPVITNINKEADGLDLTDDTKASDIYNIITGRDLYDSSDRVVTPFIG